MIPYDDIYDGMITIIRDCVGDELSTFSDGVTNYPTVIRERQAGPKPNLPYITVDIIGTVQLSNHFKEHYVNNDLEHVYEYLYELMFRITCHGEESQRILNKLRGYMNMNTIRDRIRDEACVAQQIISSAEQLPSVLTTDFEEVHAMVGTYHIIDVVIDPFSDGHVIEEVNSDYVNPLWILADGTWNDNGVWDDNAQWFDGEPSPNDLNTGFLYNGGTGTKYVHIISEPV